MSAEALFVIGATHWTTPLEIRERLSLTAEATAVLRAELAALPGLREFALLSTCNRIEFYGVGAESAAAERVQAAFCARQSFAPADFERIRLRLDGRDAVVHLLEVASGLDSQMLGETEIFGQVKEAYAAAQAGGSAGPVLNRVFQKGFQAAKQVRTQTALSSGQVSVANVAVDLALDIFGGLERARVLVLGTGEIGEKTARAFKSRGAARLVVAGRNLERAAALAGELDAEALAFGEREARLGEFDVVVCSTAAPETVLGTAAVAAALKKRPAHPLFFIDLALPRDVEAAVADLANVFLYNLDDLAKIAAENREAREAEISRSRALIQQRADPIWRHVGALLASGSGAEDSAPRPTAAPVKPVNQGG